MALDRKAESAVAACDGELVVAVKQMPNGELSLRASAQMHLLKSTRRKVKVFPTAQLSGSHTAMVCAV